MASPSSLSLAAMRAQLQSLERERETWAAQRVLQVERCAWIEQQQTQTQRRRPEDQPQTVVVTAETNGRSSVDAPVAAAAQATPSKRDHEIQQLKEKALQLAKTHQLVASTITSHLRSMRPTDTATTQAQTNVNANTNGSLAVSSRSPSPPQDKPPAVATAGVANGTTRRNKNSLVLVPTTTTALGKRQLAPGAHAVPRVHYPSLAATNEIPLETTEELASVAFRVATRHYLQTGQTISRAAMRKAIDQYIGRSLREDETCAIVEHPDSVVPLLIDDAGRDDGESLSSLRSIPTARLTHGNLHAWLDAEKSAVQELVSSWAASSTSEPWTIQLVGAVQAHAFTHSILESQPDASTTAATLLASLLGADRTGRAVAVVETAFPHLISLFRDANAWLENSVAATDAHATKRGVESVPSGLKFNRPFDLERESVMKQIHGSRKRQRRADPMKLLCMFELSGACNDPNCAFQHQRDFDESHESNEVVRSEVPHEQRGPILGGEGKPGFRLSTTAKALMNQFVQLQENVRSRWPSFAEILDSKQLGKTPSTQSLRDENTNDTRGMRSQLAASAPSNDWNEDFVELGSPSSSLGDNESALNPSSRYCHDDIAQGETALSRFSQSSLEEHLRTNPEDVDAWLLLALRSLELEVSWGDENAVRVSESEHLVGELEELHAILQTKGSRPPLSTSEDKIELALHALSRALEVEANAYCEELWLLHLRLSQLLTMSRDIEGELQMTEQALGFVRTSVSLWRHFLLLQSSCLGKLDDGVATYCALLEAIAAASKQVKRRQVKDAFSVLLCDVVIQLCSIQCASGNSPEASNFLWSLLEGRSDVTFTHAVGEEQDDMDVDSDPTQWQQVVRNQIIGDDILNLYVLHVHISMFGSIPLWLQDRSFGEAEAVNVYPLLLSPEGVQSTVGETSSEALQICEAAFQTFGDTDIVPPGMEVLRHNWIVVVATSRHVSLPTRLEKLMTIADEELRRTTLLPRVISALATLFQDSFHKTDMSTKLIEELMVRYKTVTSTRPVTHIYQRFGEALHHYLLHRPDLFEEAPFRTEFPTLKFMIARLSAILHVKNPMYSKRAIKTITDEGNWTVQRKSLGELFNALIRDTLDHIVKCQLGESGHDDADEQDIMQDTYYLVAQVQLLSQVCGVQSAIEAVDMVVIQGRSSQWFVLPCESRRIVWSVRFMLELNRLKQETELNASQELLPLLDRYLADVGPASNTSRGVKQELSSQLTRADDAAMPALGSAITLCVNYASVCTTSSLDMMLFRLCLASTPAHERPHLFAVYQQRLGMYSSFWFSCADTALQESDRRRVRSGLRRLVFEESHVLDAAALRLLVSLELEEKNVQAAAHAVGHRLKVNPLDHTAWELAGTLEVLFGGDSLSRIAEIATKLEETGGVALHIRSILTTSARIQEPTSTPTLSHVKYAGLRLELLPSPLMMRLNDSLRVLDLSNNLLVALPPAVCRLSKLRELNLSGNALVALPPLIGLLAELQVINLSHNNVSSVPNALWDRLVELRSIDVRCNALPGISPRVVHLTNLQVLRVAGNNFVWKDIEPISAKLPAGCTIDIAPASDRTAISSMRGSVVETREEIIDTEKAVLSTTSHVDNGTEVPDAKLAGIVRGAVDDKHLDPPSDESSASPPATTPPVSKTTPSPIRVDDEDESKTDSSPQIDNSPGDMDETVVEDVEMTDAIHTEAPASSTLSLLPPPRPSNDADASDDDDEVECLGSIPVLAPTSDPVATVVANASPLQASVHQDRVDSTRAVLTQSTLPTVSSQVQLEEAERRRRIAAEIQRHTDYRRCSVCSAPNAGGTHQRFNVMVLCIDCMATALEVLRERHVVP